MSSYVPPKQLKFPGKKYKKYPISIISREPSIEPPYKSNL